MAAEKKRGLVFCKAVVGGVLKVSGSVLSGLQDGTLSDVGICDPSQLYSNYSKSISNKT